MKTFIVVFINLAIVLITFSSFARAASSTNPQSTKIAINNSTTVEMFGFADLLATFRNKSDGSTFDIGQAEIDLRSDFTDHFTMALAIAYGEGVFTIGAFTADYTAWSVSDEASSTPLGIKNISIGGGQYDVRFGIDWHVYASIDRKLVSTPLVVENTHNSWNDMGVYASAEAARGNVSIFVVNGFCHEGIYPDGEEFTAHNDLAMGGRLGMTPQEFVEVGGSIATISGLDDSHEMLLVGADFRFSMAEVEIKGEYITHRLESKVYREFSNDGYYVQAVYGIGEWYLVGRYGEFRSEQRSTDLARLSAGIGYTCNDRIALRLEYQANDSIDDTAFFQVAFGF